MIPMKRFENKAALITGGGSGIGRATGIRLATEGAQVGIADIGFDKAEETCHLIEMQGGKAVPIECDVTKTEDNEKAVKETVKAFGGLHVLFPSAGIGAGGDVVETTEERWDQVINLDLRGVFLASKFAIPEMRKAKGGAVVLVSSIGGERGNWGASFCAAKGAIVNLTRSMALAHAPENIRVNCVAPGYIATPIIQRVCDDPELRKEIGKRHPLGRVGEADEVAAAIAFLASDDASYVTGAILPVDGGYLAAGQ